MTEKEYYQRNLPHFQPINGTFFITYRLAGSLPAPIINILRIELDEQLSGIETASENDDEVRNIQVKYFKKFDDLLDMAENGPRHLKDSAICQYC